MHPEKHRKRRVYSNSEKRDFVQQWLDSGRTAREFGALHNVAPQSLWRWKSQLQPGKGPPDGFRDVVVNNAVAEGRSRPDRGRPALLEIENPGGQSIRVYGGADPEWVAAIVRATNTEVSSC